jgi:leucokinin receptor
MSNEIQMCIDCTQDYLSSSNGTNYEDTQKKNIFVIIFLSMLYGSISIISVLGNSLIIFVVLKSKRMQCVTNFFICNLAIADVVIGLV